jgi:hypothetical protein
MEEESLTGVNRVESERERAGERVRERKRKREMNTTNLFVWKERERMNE